MKWIDISDSRAIVRWVKRPCTILSFRVVCIITHKMAHFPESLRKSAFGAITRIGLSLHAALAKKRKISGSSAVIWCADRLYTFILIRGGGSKLGVVRQIINYSFLVRLYVHTPTTTPTFRSIDDDGGY